MLVIASGGADDAPVAGDVSSAVDASGADDALDARETTDRRESTRADDETAVRKTVDGGDASGVASVGVRSRRLSWRSEVSADR